MKKSLFIILGLIVIVTIFGFVFYKISTVVLVVPNFDVGGKTLPTGFATLEYSSDMIQQAEEEILEAEMMLIEAKEKDLSGFDWFHRKFLENMIERMDNLMEDSKTNLENAKKSLENENYFEVSSYATSAKNIARYTKPHINKILEGREKSEWNRLTAIEIND